MRRSGHFYSRNEKETLSCLGLTPAPQSGAGWIIKEDGENEEVMVQLKSTDASSYRIDMLDIKKLEYHASVSNKLPLFLIQFLKQDKIYCLLDINDLLSVENLEKIMSLGKEETKFSLTKVKKESIDKSIPKKETQIERKIVKSSKNARNKFFEEREQNYGKRK